MSNESESVASGIPDYFGGDPMVAVQERIDLLLSLRRSVLDGTYDDAFARFLEEQGKRLESLLGERPPQSEEGGAGRDGPQPGVSP